MYKRFGKELEFLHGVGDVGTRLLFTAFFTDLAVPCVNRHTDELGSFEVRMCRIQIFKGIARMRMSLHAFEIARSMKNAVSSGKEHVA